MMTMKYRRKSCTPCGHYESSTVILTRWKDKERRCQKCLPNQVEVAPDTAQLSFEEKVETQQ